jgi:hypothetical protein
VRERAILEVMEIEELRELLDSKNIEKTEVKKVELLLDAIADWPIIVTRLLDFLSELKEDLKAESITYAVVNYKLATLNPAFDAWKMESLTAISELIKLSDFKALDEIIAYYQMMKYVPQ